MNFTANVLLLLQYSCLSVQLMIAIGAHHPLRSRCVSCAFLSSSSSLGLSTTTRRRRRVRWTSTVATTGLRSLEQPQPQQQHHSCSSSSSSAKQHSAAGLAATTTRMLSASSSDAVADSTKNRRIAVAQLCSTGCKLDNLLNVAQCAGWASRDGCAMLFLPECFGFIGTSAEQTLAAAEPPFLGHDLDPPRTNSDRVTRALVEQVRKSAATGMLDTTSERDAGQRTIVGDDSAIADSLFAQEDDRTISLLDGLQTIARESQLWISGGGLHVAVPEEPRVYNTHVIVDRAGTVRVQYRKMHLFDVCLPGKVDLRESRTTKAGEELVLCPDAPIGTLV